MLVILTFFLLLIKYCFKYKYTLLGFSSTFKLLKLNDEHKMLTWPIYWIWARCRPCVAWRGAGQIWDGPDVHLIGQTITPCYATTTIPHSYQASVMLISDTIIIYLLINIAITQLMSNSAVLYKKRIVTYIDFLCPIAIQNHKREMLKPYNL